MKKLLFILPILLCSCASSNATEKTLDMVSMDYIQNNDGYTVRCERVLKKSVEEDFYNCMKKTYNDSTGERAKDCRRNANRMEGQIVSHCQDKKLDVPMLYEMERRFMNEKSEPEYTDEELESGF